jgi:hypothetical protein
MRSPTETERARLTVVHQLALDATTVQVVRALEDLGIRAILLKGPAIASRLYDTAPERPYRDIDLLVDPELISQAEEVVMSLGFHDPLARARNQERAEHAGTWRRTRRLPEELDLHTSLYWCTSDPAGLWAQLSRHTRQLELVGTRVEVLGDAGLALVIAGHAYQHATHEKPLEDLRRAIERLDPDAWRRAAAMADELGAGAVFAAGVRCAPSGERLLAEIEAKSETSTSIRIHVDGAPPGSLGFLRLAEARLLRHRARLIAQKLFPTRAFLRSWSPPAGRSSASLPVAYLRWWLWLARSAPAGLRAYRRAKREP